MAEKQKEIGAIGLLRGTGRAPTFSLPREAEPGASVVSAPPPLGESSIWTLDDGALKIPLPLTGFKEFIITSSKPVEDESRILRLLNKDAPTKAASTESSSSSSSSQEEEEEKEPPPLTWPTTLVIESSPPLPPATTAVQGKEEGEGGKSDEEKEGGLVSKPGARRSKPSKFVPLEGAALEQMIADPRHTTTTNVFVANIPRRRSLGEILGEFTHRRTTSFKGYTYHGPGKESAIVKMDSHERAIELIRFITSLNSLRLFVNWEVRRNKKRAQREAGGTLLRGRKGRADAADGWRKSSPPRVTQVFHMEPPNLPVERRDSTSTIYARTATLVLFGIPTVITKGKLMRHITSTTGLGVKRFLYKHRTMATVEFGSHENALDAWKRLVETPFIYTVYRNEHLHEIVTGRAPLIVAWPPLDGQRLQDVF